MIWIEVSSKINAARLFKYKPFASLHSLDLVVSLVDPLDWPACETRGG